MPHGFRKREVAANRLAGNAAFGGILPEMTVFLQTSR
jgi:hypothetical protein